MNILDLASELGISPKRVASTNGGEYKSECPKCKKGTDRFCIWPNQGKSGRYWCRQCNINGDGIQFCRDFLNLTFQQACQKLNMAPKNYKIIKERAFEFEKFKPHVALPVNQVWQEAAKNFIDSSHNQLMNHPEVIDSLSRRGLSLETMQRFSIGLNSQDLFDSREKWARPPVMNDNGYPKRQWLPKGIVIPTYEANELVKIKIRRSDWFQGDTLPKYVEISGSKHSLSMYGDKSKPIIIVESELDAILIQQCAAHLVCCLALGGVSKKPDLNVHAWLNQAPLILLSLDFDDAGKKKYAFWMKLYPNLRPWPAPQAKSIGDAVQKSDVNIIKWIKSAFSIN